MLMVFKDRQNSRVTKKEYLGKSILIEFVIAFTHFFYASFLHKLIRESYFL